MRQPHQVAVRPRRIDDNEIESMLDSADRIHELPAFGSFIVDDLHGLAVLDATVHGDLEIETGAARPGVPVVDVAGEALLAAIEIYGGHPLACLRQRNGKMHRGGGLSRTALFVAEYNDVRETRLIGLHQHHLPPVEEGIVARTGLGAELSSPNRTKSL
jgi:hypothetical protein